MKLLYLSQLMLLILLFLYPITTKEFDYSFDFEMKSCQLKYSVLFPNRLERGPQSLALSMDGYNFTLFCHCQLPVSREKKPSQKTAPASLSIIDSCSFKYLNSFQHLAQYNYNLKSLIEPEVEGLLRDYLKFTGPSFSQASIDQTKFCILRSILKNCSEIASLQLTKKCSLSHIQTPKLYDAIFNKCQAFKFLPKRSTKEIRI